MTDSRKQTDPAMLEEIKNIKKHISENNMTDKLKEAFEKTLKPLDKYSNTMEKLQQLFDDSGTQSYEDAFRALGGPQFAEENKNENLDEILKKLARLHADNLNAEVKEELLKVFCKVYDHRPEQRK
ncbi:Protein of unknown function [Gryllus bimaculatus]|nr:Protein of unknown function [Gryllus bimaculatus]